MGVTISRLNSSDSHQSGSELRQRSQFNLHQLNASQPEQQPPPQQQQQQGEQDDGTMYSFYNQTNYSLARKHFSNYFIMAGERFDIDEPDYLFGDENDLNFLSCTKPYYLPYKQARLDLLALLNNKKQKATNRASRFRLPFNKFLPSLSADAVTRQTSNSTGHNNNNINQTNHHNHHSSTSNSNSRKQLQQQDELDMISRRIPTSPSKPLVMFVNIRKETLKLVPVKGENEIGNSNDSIDTIIQSSKGNNNERESNKSKKNDHVSQTSSSDETKAPHVEESSGQDDSDAKNSNNRVYNIQFNFDSEIDCTVRIFYFCTREVTSNGITYKPQHSTHKSKIYNYNKGMDQKFDQVEHTFRPHLFDEDLLMYRPLDKNGNYNPGAVFPLVVHIALNGSVPKQSYSLVATIEKSQLDNSYSIKPLKQLIFVNGVQYILQDIYGIEHKNLIPPTVPKKKDLPSNNNHNTVNGFNQPSRDNNNAVLLKTSKDKYLAKSHSLPLGLNSNNFNLNLNYRNNNNNDDNSNDNTSMNSINNLDSRRSSTRQSGNNHRDGSIRQRSLTSDANYECVICMSEERDTMLLPCRHLCLCGSCAQSLRYQANSCPICRCTFKAALNLRPCTASSHRANQNPTKRSSFASKQVSSTSPKISSKVLSNSNSGSSSGNNSNSSSCGNNNNNNIISRRETDRVAEGCAEAEEVIIESGVVGISMPEMSIDIPSSSGVIIELNVGEKSTFREKIPTSTTPLLSTPTEVVVETNKQLPNVPSSATSAGSSSKSNSNNKQDYQTDAGNWSGNEF